LHLLSGRRRPKTFRTTAAAAAAAAAVKRVQRLCTAGPVQRVAKNVRRRRVAARRPVRNRKKKIKCRHRRKLNGRRRRHRRRREKRISLIDRRRGPPATVHAVAPTRRLTVTHRPKRTHRTAALSARLASYKRGGGDECMYRAKQMQLHAAIALFLIHLLARASI